MASGSRASRASSAAVCPSAASSTSPGSTSCRASSCRLSSTSMASIASTSRPASFTATFLLRVVNSIDPRLLLGRDCEHGCWNQATSSSTLSNTSTHGPVSARLRYACTSVSGLCSAGPPLFMRPSLAAASSYAHDRASWLEAGIHRICSCSTRTRNRNSSATCVLPMPPSPARAIRAVWSRRRPETRDW